MKIAVDVNHPAHIRGFERAVEMLKKGEEKGVFAWGRCGEDEGRAYTGSIEKGR